MILRFEGCKGCQNITPKLGQGVPIAMRDWWLHQLHLFVKHDHVEHWRKLYPSPLWFHSWEEKIVRDIMTRRANCVRDELRKIGVDL